MKESLKEQLQKLLVDKNPELKKSLEEKEKEDKKSRENEIRQMVIKETKRKDLCGPFKHEIIQAFKLAREGRFGESLTKYLGEMDPLLLKGDWSQWKAVVYKEKFLWLTDRDIYRSLPAYREFELYSLNVLAENSYIFKEDLTEEDIMEAAKALENCVWTVGDIEDDLMK